MLDQVDDGQDRERNDDHDRSHLAESLVELGVAGHVLSVARH